MSEATADDERAAVVRSLTFPHTYRDSVEMMRLAAALEQQPGIRRAAALMATPANRQLLDESGLLAEDGSAAGPDDLIIAVLADSSGDAESALGSARALLLSAAAPTALGESGVEHAMPRTIAAAVAGTPRPSLALISVPGPYAAAEALKALKKGLHVFLFSDNVAIDDEVMLKRLAIERGLLLMGPDCGTAILDGIPLGFANVVRRGRIGLVSASGTGLQQVSCLIDRLGSGVSQAIGVGGRDLSEPVGGLMMRRGIDLLARDPGTSVIVLISKPPSPGGFENVLEAARNAAKPVVACFVGGDPGAIRAAGLRAAATLEEAALIAVDLDLGRPGIPEAASSAFGEGDPLPPVRFGSRQKYVRGLFAGGTFCAEAHQILAARLGSVAEIEEGSPSQVRGNAVVDLGADVFTRGRPHPMIDARLRAEWISASAADPAVAVILLDVILGYGADPDPVGSLGPAILDAQERAARLGRQIAFVGSVCGTRGDPQGLDHQVEKLRALSVRIQGSNAAACRLAADLLK